MPITGPASYVPTANQFISHWESSNLALGARWSEKNKPGQNPISSVEA